MYLWRKITLSLIQKHTQSSFNVIQYCSVSIYICSTEIIMIKVLHCVSIMSISCSVNWKRVSTHSPVGSSSLISNQTRRSYLLTHWPRFDLVMVFNLVAGTDNHIHDIWAIYIRLIQFDCVMLWIRSCLWLHWHALKSAARTEISPRARSTFKAIQCNGTEWDIKLPRHPAVWHFRITLKLKQANLCGTEPHLCVKMNIIPGENVGNWTTVQPIKT